MEDILNELETRREKARIGGGQKRIDTQHSKGKLTARERIELLVDEGSFEEWDMFVEQEPNELTAHVDPIPGDGVITGGGQLMEELFSYFPKTLLFLGDHYLKPMQKKSVK